jgi:hypothetical protein
MKNQIKLSRQALFVELKNTKTREEVIIWFDSVNLSLKAGSITQHNFDWLLNESYTHCDSIKVINPLK